MALRNLANLPGRERWQSPVPANAATAHERQTTRNQQVAIELPSSPPLSCRPREMRKSREEMRMEEPKPDPG